MSVASERAMSSQIDAYVGGGGSEWASGDTDPDDDFVLGDLCNKTAQAKPMLRTVRFH